MKKQILLIISLMLLALNPILAKVWNVDNLPVTQNVVTVIDENYPDSLIFPSKPTYVSNPDGILSQTEVDRIDEMLFATEKSKGVKALVVVITNIEGDDPYRFATDLGNKYGVGTKDDTGIVLVLATDDRSYWIATGTGMEKYLPDAICKRVENRVMVPLLKEGKWGDAVVETVSTITQLLEGNEELRASYTEEGDDFDWLVMPVTLGIIGTGVGASYYSERKKKKCKKCNKYKMKMISRKTRNISKSTEEITEEWVCTECGHSEIRKRQNRRADFYDGSSTGGFSGGGSRSHSGPSFGSFGGGSFSGGGAGGRF